MPEPVTTKGFVFMDTPGYDPVSATGQGGGANILCFTTGRGSAYGCKPTPSIKLATNTPVYERMIDDMDINCGDVLDGVSIADKGEEIFRHILKNRFRRAQQVRKTGLWRRRIRALANRRHHVASDVAAGPRNPLKCGQRTSDPKGAGMQKKPIVERRYVVAFALTATLFFSWGLASQFNDLLLHHFQQALDLSRTRASLTQFAFYIGYFCAPCRPR